MDCVDVLVAGYGATGASLALHLGRGRTAGWRVAFVDDDRVPLRGRSWAYWTTRPDLVQPAVVARWSALRVRTPQDERRLPLARYAYLLVDAARLERLADGVIERLPGFRRVHGTVDGVEHRADGAVVTVSGTPIHARWVLDAVTVPWPVADVELRFEGWDVAARADRVPAVPVLMDFHVPQEGAVRFLYVLPTGADRVLVEHTSFVRPGAPPPAVRPRDVVAGYARDVLGAPGPPAIAEHGVLPLGTGRRTRRVLPHVLAVGVTGGLLKPSTGYAFGRIQRDAAAIARSLAVRGHPFDLRAPRRRHRFGDEVLLRLLLDEPEQVPAAFGRLFAGPAADPVLAFLDEDTDLVDEVRLLGRLPLAPFARAAAARRRR